MFRFLIYFPCAICDYQFVSNILLFIMIFIRDVFNDINDMMTIVLVYI